MTSTRHVPHPPLASSPGKFSEHARRAKAARTIDAAIDAAIPPTTLTGQRFADLQGVSTSGTIGHRSRFVTLHHRLPDTVTPLEPRNTDRC